MSGASPIAGTVVDIWVSNPLSTTSVKTYRGQSYTRYIGNTLYIFAGTTLSTGTTFDGFSVTSGSLSTISVMKVYGIS
jgi:hypothetical protein